MASLIISAIFFFSWALAITIIYYTNFYSSIDHSVASEAYGGYLMTVLILYGIYKFLSLSFSWKKIQFGFWSIFGLILFHILIVCVFYSSLPSTIQSPFMQNMNISGVTLFFHVLQLLIYPILLVIIARAIGYSLCGIFLSHWNSIDIRIRVPAEITLGFLIFSTGLVAIGSLGYFTLPGLLMVIIVMSILGYRGLRETYHDITQRRLELENHDLDGDIVQAVNLRLLSIELSFIVVTFLLSVSLVNVIRPMPIGWDDLGVYMNYPKIIATTGELLQGGSMYAWQLITATGFLFSFNAAQAFYINQLGGILAVLAIILTLSYAFEKKGRVALISLPILFATLYYAMPMTVFQQAKDMKLDPAYLFFSISGLMLLFHAWRKNEQHEKWNYKLLLLIGVIIGFTFSVKFTSVMFIIAALGVVAYRLLSFTGYIGFFFIFLAIFTKLDFWKMMNIQMPRDNPELMMKLWMILGVIGIGFLIYSIYRNTQGFKSIAIHWFASSAILILGFALGSSPWLIKNASESGGTPSLMTLLNGSGGVGVYPYESFYTAEELAAKKAQAAEGFTKEGSSENEDMGRYFGYESGLNNYLKLPANLTFQKNQAGEFTDITYIFLALLPGLLLFIHGKRALTMVVWGGLLILFMTFYYFKQDAGGKISEFFSQFTILIEPGNWKSYGYAILLLLNIGFLTIVEYATKDTETNRRLREVCMFLGIYGFLFAIAAFGIVWYGIIIYFAFFLLMGYAAERFTHEDTLEEETRTGGEKTMLHFFLSLILFGFIAFYLVASAFPHGWNNLKSAYYNEYKYYTLTQEESIFAYRSDYLTPIARLNLRDISRIYEGAKEKMQSTQMKEFFSNPEIKNLPIESMHNFIMRTRLSTKDPLLKSDIETLSKHIYNQVLYPPADNSNTGGIYRIGTFMTYLINNNRKRYLEDSLIFTFNDYFYDASPEKTVGRMEKLGLRYLLIDLNAATIDRDPRRALTTRSERLLLTMNAQNLELISTDNLCLQIAIAERKKGKLQSDIEFLDIAATNSESYRNGQTIYRNQKQANCYRYILSMINEGRASEYPQVEAIKNELLENNAAQNPQVVQGVFQKYAGQSWFALFAITDLREKITPPPSELGSSGSLK